MPRRVSPAAVPPRKPVLKSPLRAATMSPVFPGSPAPEVVPPPAREMTAQQLRLMQVSEFAAWLRTQTSPKTKRPSGQRSQPALGNVEG